ncbi:hypothetical protein ACHGLL_004404 [Escherichia coli]
MFISRVPSKGTPLIFLGVASLFAATAVPPDGRASAALFTVSRKPGFSDMYDNGFHRHYSGFSGWIMYAYWLCTRVNK